MEVNGRKQDEKTPDQMCQEKIFRCTVNIGLCDEDGMCRVEFNQSLIIPGDFDAGREMFTEYWLEAVKEFKKRANKE